MATVRLVENCDSDLGYGYLTIDNLSQEEIEKVVSDIVGMLNAEYLDADGTPCWCIEDITCHLTEKGYKWHISDEYEVNV